MFCSGYKRLTKLNNVRWWNGTASTTNNELKDQSSREEANYKARVDLAVTYRALEYYGMGEGICNHLTLRAPSRVREEDVMLLIPYGMHWREVTASSLMGIDFFTGEVVEGEGEPNISASCIHRPIHNVRYPIDGMKAVLHTHQPYTTAIACMNDPEPFKIGATQNSMRFLDRIAYDEDYDGFANASDEGERLAKVLGTKDILLMKQHGVLSVAKRACDAFDYLYYLERAAQLQVLLMSSGAQMMKAPHEVIKSVADDDCYEHNAYAFFESMKRILADEKPNYMD
ncbi:putative aldolase class 2 protein PA3430 isoform X2 [Lytechinus pictus]|uniref:putative aldolase class 2 protein PA3430 isoform X2 n=1 Tax=Lytechinus pictus TaxID=7653 RepID=UPI0030B9F9B8